MGSRRLRRCAPQGSASYEVGEHLGRDGQAISTRSIIISGKNFRPGPIWGGRVRSKAVRTSGYAKLSPADNNGRWSGRAANPSNCPSRGRPQAHILRIPSAPRRRIARAAERCRRTVGWDNKGKLRSSRWRSRTRPAEGRPDRKSAFLAPRLLNRRSRPARIRRAHCPDDAARASGAGHAPALAASKLGCR